jgi:hypothetical protein
MNRNPAPPYWAYLGIAPPLPVGALAVAPRAILAPRFTLGQVVARPPAGGYSPLALNLYAIPIAVTPQGEPFSPLVISGAIPNPYAGP